MGVHVHFKATVWIIILSFLVLGSSGTVGAKPRKGHFGIKAGIIREGPIKYNPKGITSLVSEVETDDSYSAGIFVEYPAYRRLFVTFSADIYDVRKNLPGEDISELFLDVGLGLKMKSIGSDTRLAVQPGFIMGFGWFPEVQRLGLESTKHLTVKAFTEFVFYTGGGAGLLFELGLVWAPSGGNDHDDVTAGPMALMRFGLTSLK